ncbi:MAG: energy transducer TonB [Gemmatimonadota bacterium]|nr:MAG: energy transducer TonB [Gemmatimonadota bacterium]
MRQALASCIALFVLTTCSADRSDRGGQTDSGADSGFHLPVLTNSESPVAYPVDLYEQQVEASVILRLFVTQEGIVVPESTRVAETSGYPALDSAALAGVSSMSFAPARQDGQPVAAMFLQPIHFRHPARSGSGERL